MSTVCQIYGLNYEWSYILFVDGKMVKRGALKSERLDDATKEASGMFPGVMIERGLC